MQKKLLTIAVAGALAAPVAAFADVTVYGSLDMGIHQQSKVLTGVGVETGSVLSVDPQIKKTNRWGLKGSDDLGGGLMANFTLEGAYTPDTSGESLDGFDRKAIVGLSKGGNSVDLGRNYTLLFVTQGIWDPMSHDYGGAAKYEGTTTQGVRYNNAITGNFNFGTGGLGVQYAPGENPAGSSRGAVTSVSGNFAFGPVVLGAAFATMKDATGGTADTKSTQFGGKYSMGAFTFRAGFGTQEVDGTSKEKKISAGVQYAMSPTLNGRVGYYNLKSENSTGTELGTGKVVVVTLEYSMSKSTIAYLEFDRKALEGDQLGTAAGGLADGATGIGAGLSVSF
jgi:predicted porin